MNLNQLINTPHEVHTNNKISLPPISDILIKGPISPLPPPPPLIHYYDYSNIYSNDNHRKYSYYIPLQQPIGQLASQSNYQSSNSVQLLPSPPQQPQLTPPLKQSVTDTTSTSPILSPNSSHIDESIKRKTRNNLPKEATYILLKWLNDHLNHPYPNSFEKNQLMLSTGLNQQQLSNWFINARRRKIKLLKEQKKLNS